MFRRILIAAGLLLLVVIGAFAAVIAFNAPTAPPVLAAGNSIPGIAQWNFAELPKPQTLKARDGAPINYRLYPGRPDRAVVLVHGSIGHRRLDAQACPGAAGGRRQRLRDQPARPWRQRHGQRRRLLHGPARRRSGRPRQRSRPRKARHTSHAHRLFLRRRLRVAHRRRQAGRPVQRLSRDLALHRPGLADQQAERRRLGRTWRCRASSRCRCSTSVGLPWFQDLPVVHFATDAKPSNSRTPVYSFRLAASLQLGRDWRGVLARISAPTEIVIGANDELFNADQFKPMLQSINPRIGVTIVPNADSSRHDRRSSGDGRHRRRLAKVGRRLTPG